jgi:hypothetical protein
MGVEYGENFPSNELHKASYSREFLPTGGFACFLAFYWGGIPRKEVGQRGSTPGVECGETPLFRRWNVEKNFACKDVAYELFTFSVFHFFSEMGSLPSVSSWMRTNKPFCQPAALYPTAVGENAGQLFHDGSCATRPMSVPSKPPRPAPVAGRQLIVEVFASVPMSVCLLSETLLQSRLEVSTNDSTLKPN